MPANNLAPTHASSVYPSNRAYAGSTHVTTIEPLEDGTPGTLRSLDAMRDAVLGRIGPDHSGYRDPWIKQAAIEICQRSNSGNPIRGLFAYLRDSVEYVNHPFNLQVVKDARRTIESGSGDCVSKSTALATLLASLGFTPRLVAQASDGESFDHVFLEVWHGGSWISLDPTADGKDGRPFGEVGWFNVLPPEGLETTREIF